jgi:tetratricopeptide (TPR) repeat protein
MPNREEIDLKERADRALRAGRTDEALVFYGMLLGRVQVFSAGVYDGWLEGALGAYQAAGRKIEAGYVLMGLRRFADAQLQFSAEQQPLPWALCAAKLKRFNEAARVLSAAGHPGLAAIELEHAGALGAACVEWERALRDPRLTGRPYETALVQFNLGGCLLARGEASLGHQALSAAQRGLEQLADEYETRGDRERAFDCYGALLRLGKDTGSFENVAEGYLNSIRILGADDQKFFVLQYYDDFLTYAVEQGEFYAAATLAREAADYSAKTGLVYDRHYLARATALWAETAARNQQAGGPVDLSENALHAGIDAAAALGDVAALGRLYAQLAQLPLAVAKHERYARLSRRYAGAEDANGSPPPPGFPEYLRRSGAYQDVWRQDLIEWELDGDLVAVLCRLVVDRTDHARFSRLALRALLQTGPVLSRTEDATGLSELAVALGRIQVYEVLRPLERLYDESAAAEVRRAVMAGVGQVYCRRSFALVRRGLQDPAERVRQQALLALRGLRFRDGLEPLVRIFRESTEEPVRIAALETIADLGSVEAGMVVLDAVLQEEGPIRAAAEQRLGSFRSDDLVPLMRQVLDAQGDDASPALRRALADITRAGQ